MLSNPRYSSDFVYIGAFIENRHKIIEDGLPEDLVDGKYTQKKIREREEQSDLVILLLNLAYVPDDVIKKLVDFNPGWSIKFKALMEEYHS